jgi:hypothetical protein
VFGQLVIFPLRNPSHDNEIIVRPGRAFGNPARNLCASIVGRPLAPNDTKMARRSAKSALRLRRLLARLSVLP